jgi:acyl-CoA thioester hydrolase
LAMSRVKVDVPEPFSFSTTIPIRITDLNYGGHVGNDTVLSLIHEARVQFLRTASYDEMNVEGVGLIMSDAAIEFKSEIFYSETVKVFVKAANFSRIGFDLYYKLLKDDTTVALAKTGMVCFNYEKRKVVSVPQAAVEKLGRLSV